MTVAELIAELSDLPPDLEVLVTDDDGGDCNTIRQVLDENWVIPGQRWVYLTSTPDPASVEHPQDRGIDYDAQMESGRAIKYGD